MNKLEMMINLMINELQPTYGKTYVHGEAFTQWTCKGCGAIDMHPNTNTPIYCKDCLRKIFEERAEKELSLKLEQEEFNEYLDEREM